LAIQPKPIRWSEHAQWKLTERSIDRVVVERTLRDWDFRVPDKIPRKEILMRRYHDDVLNREMLLRVVIEESALEIVIITVYKTSRMSRYLKGMT
jgi:hypothetical protein